MWSATLVQLHRASAPSKRDQTLTKPRVWWGRRGSESLTPRLAGKVTWWCTVPSSPSNEAINSTQSPHHRTITIHQRPKLPQTAGDSSSSPEDSSLYAPTEIPPGFLCREISSSSAPAKFSRWVSWFFFFFLFIHE